MAERGSRAKPDREAAIVTYAFLSAFLAVLGIALTVTMAAVAVHRARQDRELARRKTELASEQELENYLGRLDQAATDGDIDRLGDHGNEGKD